VELSKLDDLKTIYTSEWSILKPAKIRMMYGNIQIDYEDYNLINELEEQRKLKVKQFSEGMEIETYSYVGVIRFSNFQVIIKPKIDDICLAKMISYSYNLDLENIRYYDFTVSLDTERAAITDVIALLYIKEVEKIILKGLANRYKQKEEDLSSCRGKIVFNDLAKKSTADLTLPCRYGELTTDIAENRLIYSTLEFLKKHISSSRISRKINILSEKLSDKVSYQKMNKTLFQKVNKESNRLTKHYEKVIKLSKFIYENQDFSLISRKMGFSSFLIDMNELFEKFLYRLFEVTFQYQLDIKYQNSLKNNYIASDGQNRSLIPDYQFYKDNVLIGIADAKYKDYQKKKVSSGDLYQLTAYAVANTNSINNIMLFYPLRENQQIEEYSLYSYLIEDDINIINIGISIENCLEDLKSSQYYLNNIIGKFMR